MLKWDEWFCDQVKSPVVGGTWGDVKSGTRLPSASGRHDGPVAWSLEPGLESGSSSDPEVGIHGVSADESDAVSDSRSRLMLVDTGCGYEGGRKAFVDVSWDGP